MLDDKTIQKTIRRYVLEEQANLAEYHLTDPPKSDAEHEVHVELVQENLGRLQAVLATSEFAGTDQFPSTTFTENIELEVCKLFKIDHATTDTTTIEFKKACREYTRASSELWTDHLQRLEGHIGPSEPSYLSSVPVAPVDPAAPVATVKKPRGPRISSQFI